MLGSLITAGTSLLGGLFGNKQADKQAALQKEFAQNAIQWKAKDAEAAGISKIFAMGAPTVSYSPVSTGDSGISSAGAALGKGISGQLGNLGTTSGKISGIQQQIADAQLTGINLDNDIKRADLLSKQAIATQPGAGGILDHAVTTGPEGVKLKKEIAPGSPGKDFTEFGVSPEVAMYKTPNGYAPQIPQQLQEAFESDMLSRWQWNLRNKIMPGYSDTNKATGPAPVGSYWSYNPLIGEYELARKSDFHRNYENYWSRRNPQEYRR